MIKSLLLIIITIFIPPIGVFLVAGCGVDLLINILLTVLGYAPPLPLKTFLHPLSHSLLSFCHHYVHETKLTGIPTSYFPGHIHAFYVEYVYFKRRDEVRAGIYNARPAPGVYSQKVQSGGHRGAPPPVAAQGPAGPAPVPAQQGYLVQPGQQQGYGTVH
ncbi:Nn.00g082750.m01.CDS01 [Neocucurbitaria sp. VM-36]